MVYYTGDIKKILDDGRIPILPYTLLRTGVL